MSIPLEDVSWLLSHASDVVIQVDANDPRSCPTEVLLIVVDSGVTLAELERLPHQLREECGWEFGYEVDLRKRAGGIGADGLTLAGLILGVVGAVPTIESIFRKFGRQTPVAPDRGSALNTATWAVCMQYRGISRNGLRVVKEERHQDHWTLTMTFDESGDTFEVDVYGTPRSGPVATRVVWQNGDPWGRKPGATGTEA